MAYGPVKYVDGLSYYAWVSLIVKSVRIGWPEGIRQAEARIGPYVTKRTATVQIFEDIFPAAKDLKTVQSLVWSGNWDELCSYDTHHGRGLTEWFLMAWESGYGDYADEHQEEINALAETYGFKKPQPRMLGDFYTWTKINNNLTDTPRREIDTAPWKGIPIDVIDRHTVEGKRNKSLDTILSGTNEGHRWLAKEVGAKGWAQVRSEIHSKRVFEVTERPPNQKQQPKSAPIIKGHKFTQSTLLSL